MAENRLSAPPVLGAPRNRWDLYLYEQRRLMARFNMRAKEKAARTSLLLSVVKLVIVVLVVLCVFKNAFADDCMRCSGRLACVGDNMVEVFLTCGEPDFHGTVSTEINGDRDVVVIGGVAYFSTGSYSKSRVERWVYIMGPGRYMRILTFEGDELVKIETGNKP